MDKNKKKEEKLKEEIMKAVEEGDLETFSELIKKVKIEREEKNKLIRDMLVVWMLNKMARDNENYIEGVKILISLLQKEEEIEIKKEKLQEKEKEKIPPSALTYLGGNKFAIDWNQIKVRDENNIEEGGADEKIN